MKYAIDSCVWIAYASIRDQDHTAAGRIVEDFMDDKSQVFYLTDYVVLEVTNFLLRRINPKTAFEMMDQITQHERIHVGFVDKEMFEETSAIAMQLKTSLTDASLVSLMKRGGIKTIYSFDSGFDRVKGLERRDG
jgi:predicted nucleic acid-binding protein